VTQLTIATHLTITNRGSEFFYSPLWLNILIFLCFFPGLKHYHCWTCRNTIQYLEMILSSLPSRNVHISP
jgi:hypothetical protein